MVFRKASRKEVVDLGYDFPHVVCLSSVGSNDILICTIKDMNEAQWRAMDKVLNSHPDYIICDQDYKFSVVHFDERDEVVK